MPPDSPYFADHDTLYEGWKYYEISNHLGNVMATINDRKAQFDTDADDEAEYYEAAILSATDYYPFGFDMPGRKYQVGDYRYGFNGKEQDTDGEWGQLTHYDYGFRIYNPGIARFLSVDPLTKGYPWYTPYQFAGNKPIVAVDIDGLEELIIHSAFWTEKLLGLDLAAMTYKEILAEANRINNKGYIDDRSLLYAKQFYESDGQVTTINPAPEGTLNITGFTNANSGDVVKFSIFSSVEGGFIKIDIPEFKHPKGLGERIKGKGVQDIMGTFVMKYSGFGKIGRALINYQEGEDPWTGDKGSTSGLIVGGITDLATLGYGGTASATTNMVLNLSQEILERLEPDQLEEIGIGRETVDLGLSLTEPNKVVKTVEVISNLIQAGYLTNDLIEKYGSENKNSN